MSLVKKNILLHRILIAQIVLLVLVIVLGFILRADPYDGPRSLHRLIGIVSAVTALASAILLMKQKITINQVALAWVPLTLIMFAAISGNLLGSVDAYEMVFNLMLMSGILSLVASVAVLVMVRKLKSKTSAKVTPEKKTSEA